MALSVLSRARRLGEAERRCRRSMQEAQAAHLIAFACCSTSISTYCHQASQYGRTAITDDPRPGEVGQDAMYVIPVRRVDGQHALAFEEQLFALRAVGQVP